MSKIHHATQDWTKEEISNLVDSAPENLDTLNELAAEIIKKADKIDVIPTTLTEATIKPNVFYSFTGIDFLIVTLDVTSTTKLDEFMFSFETPKTADSAFLYIISDNEIKWVKEPNIKPNYIYEVSIVNNVGVIAGIPKEVS